MYTEVFIRVVGMLMIFIGVYEILAAWRGRVDFFRWSILIRASGMLFFAAFVLLGYAPATLLLFAGVDLFGAIWTGWALYSDHMGIFTSTKPLQP